MTVDQAIHEAAAHIVRRDAELLLAHLLQRDRTWLIMHSRDILSVEIQAQLQDLVARRARCEPLQYILGEQEFYGLPLRVTPDTLIPRPETEHLVEAVLEASSRLHQPPRIVDVGTGTGAIALALAKNLPEARIYACDLSLAALEVAKDNALHLGLSERIEFRQSDLLAGYISTGSGDDLFDAVVSNPPYVPAGDAAEMQPDVRDYEPHMALFAGDDGLAIYRRLVVEAHTLIRPEGLLAMEIGFGQRNALAALLAAWRGVRFVDDYAGIARVVLAEKPDA
jgi:release factor glutamine methyltransferase